MKVGIVHTITLGQYTGQYICTVYTGSSYQLRRGIPPKSKIDAIRLPEYIIISQHN